MSYEIAVAMQYALSNETATADLSPPIADSGLPVAYVASAKARILVTNSSGSELIIFIPSTPTPSESVMFLTKAANTVGGYSGPRFLPIVLPISYNNPLGNYFISSAHLRTTVECAMTTRDAAGGNAIEGVTLVAGLNDYPVLSELSIQGLQSLCTSSGTLFKSQMVDNATVRQVSSGRITPVSSNLEDNYTTKILNSVTLAGPGSVTIASETTDELYTNLPSMYSRSVAINARPNITVTGSQNAVVTVRFIYFSVWCYNVLQPDGSYQAIGQTVSTSYLHNLTVISA